MSDVLSICQGNLYDPGSIYDYWNLVISSNNHNKEFNTIICCLVKPFNQNKEIDKYDIVFDFYGIKYKILVNCICNYSKRKIGNYSYKGTLSNELMARVIKLTKEILFDQPVYTLDEARRELSEREIILSAQYSSQNIKADSIIAPIIEQPTNNSFSRKTNIKLSLEDEEKAFANSIGDYEIEHEPIKLFNVTPNHSKESKIEKDEEILVEVPVAKSNVANKNNTIVSQNVLEKALEKNENLKSKVSTNKKKVCRNRNDLVYDNLDQFIKDYKSKSKEEILEIYQIPDKVKLSKIIYAIKISHNIDLSDKALNRKRVQTKRTIRNNSKYNKSFCEDFILDYYSLSDKELAAKYNLKNNKKEIYNTITNAKRAFLKYGGDKEVLKNIKSLSNKKSGRRGVEV